MSCESRLGDVDLRRWALLHALVRQLDRGQIGAEEARGQLERIEEAPFYWGPPATILAYVLSAGSFAVFFGAGTAELGAALAVGLAVGFAAVALKRVRASSRLFELVAAAGAGLIVGSVDLPLGAFADWVPLAAGMIILLPGIMLIDATEELAQGHLVAGSARMAGVGVVFLAMTIGVLLGLKATEWIPGPPVMHEPSPLPDLDLVAGPVFGGAGIDDPLRSGAGGLPLDSARLGSGVRRGPAGLGCAGAGLRRILRGLGARPDRPAGRRASAA